MSCYLGIDIGTSGSRALVIEETGKALSSASAPHTCQSPRALWSEQDPGEWWQAVRQAVPAAVRASGVSPGEIKAVGLSGQMHGLTLLDGSGEVVRPAILWNDQRTSLECEELTSRAGGLEALLRMVGNPALTGFTAPKILWVRAQEPRNFERARKVLLPKDFIRYRLTGEFATEVSDASGTLLLDVAARSWSRPLLEALQIPPELLPAVHESTAISGRISRQASQDLDGMLREGTPVVGGGGDQAAGGVGAGIVRRGIGSISLGTSGVVFLHADEAQIDPAGRLHTFCHAVPGKWHQMGVSLSSGGSLQWFRNALGQTEVERARKESPQSDPYDLLIETARQEPPGSGGLFFLPYLTGERTPHADPYARGAFVGITPATSKAALVRAVIEGVCYSLRDSVELFRALRLPVEEIRVTGGGARNPFWRQMLADMLGQPTVALRVAEGPAYGVALLAAVGGGAFQSVEEACGATVGTCDPLAPDRTAQRLYDERYGLWQELYRALKGHFRKAAGQ